MTSHEKDATRRRFVLGKSAAMAVLGFASGLPLVVFTGTVLAWFTHYDVDARSIGVFSMVALPYAFKFLWSPLVSAVDPPAVRRLLRTSRTRGWILGSLALITPILLAIPLLDPTRAVALIALFTLLGVFASATQDIAIAGWRIQIADDKEELDRLTAIEQLSYRSAVFFGAAVALVVAQNFGWGTAWLFTAGLMALCFVGAFFVPEVRGDGAPAVAGAPALLPGDDDAIRLGGTLPPARRRAYVRPVLGAWGFSLAVVFAFMVYVLAFAPEISVRDFTLYGGPFIVLICLLAPLLAARGVLRDAGAELVTETPAATGWDVLYRSLLEPFIDFVVRLRWALVPITILVLSYRYTDAVWGAFAYPFYLGAPEVNGGLGHSLAEVAAASKVFGALMTLAGISLGALLLRRIGQMPTLVLGAVLAALTNLLYADLALGGAYIDRFIRLVRVDVVFPAINALVNLLSPDEDVVVGDALGRLIVVISAENLAVGLASVVYVAYLSSIVSKRYAAVQFAILASLTMLVVVLGRGYLGELIDQRGFAFVFILTAILGSVGVGASIAEWIRQSRAGAGGAPPPGGVAAEAAADTGVA